ncbi:hypothetical protein P9112_002837 [Eukaryota sp. TZLM1-RC]
MKSVDYFFPLSQELYKGNAGKIAIFGGSIEYCGAPYYAAYSALKIGADLAYVVCSPSAANPIKSYSPDLIVYPFLYDLDKAKELLSRFSAVVIGPGIGRSEESITAMKTIIPLALDTVKVVVLDGDALWLLSQYPSLFAKKSQLGNQNNVLVLTPNFMELTRICETYLGHTPKDVHDNMSCYVAQHFGPNTFVIQKGPTDFIGRFCGLTRSVNAPSIMRRCGGQGDVMVGFVATLCFWSLERDIDIMEALCFACEYLRYKAEVAFRKCGRSMTTSDIIKCI